jgi:penicillin-binding protein 1A
MNLGRKSLESGSDKRERKRERSGKRAALLIIRSVIAFLIILIAGIAVFSWLYVKRLINKLPDASTIDISPTGYSTTILDSDGNNIQTACSCRIQP